MMAKEEKEDAERAVSQTGNAMGVMHDSLKPGQWFSNPKDSVKQLAAPGGALPVTSPAAHVSKPKNTAKGTNGVPAKAAPDFSEFDAW
jgi:hypothetical protein